MNIKELQKVLAKLGRSSDKVASNLEDKGIKGFPKDPFSCPIANYLRSQLYDNSIRVFYDEYYDEYGNSIVIRSADDKSYRPNEAIQTFVKKFDEGHYLQLREDVVY